MAALNTLRTKGGVVLAVVIGLSLLAFLLGDLTSSSGALFSSSNTAVGVINGTKVSIDEYSNEIDKLKLVQSMLSNREVQGEEEVQAIRTQSWEKIVRNNLFDEDFYKLGFIISEDEKLDMVSGEFISPMLSSIFVDETGSYNRAMVREFAANIEYDPSGATSVFWDYMEDEISAARAMSKYLTVVKNGVYTTSVEVDQYIKALETTSTIEYATTSVYSVPDSLVTVTDSDLKAYYNARIEQFKQTESRDIEYVVFEALPSDKDYASAKKEVDEIAGEFAVTSDIEQFVNLNSATSFDPTYRKSNELSADLAEFIFTDEAKAGAMFGPILRSDVYTMVRVVDTKQLPDTLGAKHILVSSSSKQLADSIATILKKDKSQFADLSYQFSLDPNASLSGGELGEFAVSAMIPEFSLPIAQAKVGEILTVETQYGIHVVEVTKIGEKFPKAQLAIVTYNVDPSNETSQLTYASATEFASKAGAKGAEFDVVAFDMGASKRVARLRAGERSLQGIDGSSEIVRWVFDNKAGAVSPVISVGEQNIIAKVVTANDYGYISFENAKKDFSNLVYNEKKAQYLIDQLGSAKDVAEVASKWGVEADQASDVNFRSFYISGLGMAPKVLGAVSALNTGETSTPIESMGSVSVVKVVSQTPTENINKASEKALLQATAENSYQQRVMSAVYAKSDVIDMRIKFF